MTFPNKAQQNDIRQSLPPITGIYPTMNMMLTGKFNHYFRAKEKNNFRCSMLNDHLSMQVIQQQPVHILDARDHRTSIQTIIKIIAHPDKDLHLFIQSDSQHFQTKYRTLFLLTLKKK